MPEDYLALTLPNAALPRRESARDSARLGRLMADHYDNVWRFLRRLGLPPADADDAAQEVLLVAAKKLEVIVAGSERSFLLGTAVRVAQTHRRLRARRREDGEDVLFAIEDLADGPDAMTDQKRAREMLDAILLRMPMDLRVVFVLFELEGMTMAEISNDLSIASGTVASRLRRAREDFDTRLRRIAAVQPERGGTP